MTIVVFKKKEKLRVKKLDTSWLKNERIMVIVMSRPIETYNVVKIRVVDVKIT